MVLYFLFRALFFFFFGMFLLFFLFVFVLLVRGLVVTCLAATLLHCKVTFTSFCACFAWGGVLTSALGCIVVVETIFLLLPGVVHVSIHEALIVLLFVFMYCGCTLT